MVEPGWAVLLLRTSAFDLRREILLRCAQSSENVAGCLRQVRPDCTEALKATLAKRIMIMDGAMGTMVQTHKLSEEDFRGTPRDL